MTSARLPVLSRHRPTLFLLWLAFVVYGSLLPFDLRDLSLDEAITSFSNIQFLDLGVVSRADWIANILLYIPLAYLGCNWIAAATSSLTGKATAIATVLLLCALTAVGVEFSQTFFAPRTVSLNDLLAEGIGSILGVLIWIFYGKRIHELLNAFSNGGPSSVLAAFSLFGGAYVLLALFPFDFVISMQELRWKLSSDNLGLLFASNCQGVLRCSASQVGELVAILPLGLLLSVINPRLSLKRVFLAGAALSFGLELVQLFLASGTTQGASVLIRGIGLVLGLQLGQTLQQHGMQGIASVIRRLAPWVLLPYLVAVIALSGLLTHPWIDPGTAVERFFQIKPLPLYYHYFSTETHAVASLLAQATMYAPLGILVWARGFRYHSQGTRRYLVAAIFAGALSLPVEISKLGVPPLHPDLTNVLIAAFGAAFAHWVASWFTAVISGEKRAADTQVTAEDKDLPERTSRDEIPTDQDPPHVKPRLSGLAVASTALIALAFGVANHPANAFLVLPLLVAYGLLLYRYSWSWLFVIPVALPALDLSPHTGRLLLDEFDLLVLLTLAMGYWRIYPLRARSWPRHTLVIATSLLWISWVIAFGRGIWPLQYEPDTLLASSHTPWEAWYVGKGLLWALLFVPLMRRLPRQQTDTAQTYLISGIVTGLLLVVSTVLWERIAFVGLTNFENVFRVTGTFASMHTGGAYIEGYLAFAFPVLVVWILRQNLWSYRAAGLVLVGISAYAMAVTYSRGGYAGLIASILVVALGIALRGRKRPRYAGRALAGVALAAFAIGVPVVSGEFAQYRLNRSLDDLNVRLAHWSQALSLMDDGLPTALGGMGFGTYPTRYLYHANQTGQLPGNFSIQKENGGNYLRLTPGDALYLEQIVDVQPDTKYTIVTRVHLPAGPTSLSVPLCEKALLYSFNCTWTQLDPPSAPGWHFLTTEINSGDVGNNGILPLRPVKLSLYNSGSENPLDIDLIVLLDQDSNNLLSNSDFNGSDHWLYVTDRDLAWHIHQQQVETYFAQGLLGLLAFLFLVFATVRILGRGVAAGDTYALAFSGGLAGLLTVGLLGSTVDTARLSMLFYFAFFSGALLTDKGRRRTIVRRIRSKPKTTPADP